MQSWPINANGGVTGEVGVYDQPGADWTHVYEKACDAQEHLYCFEQ